MHLHGWNEEDSERVVTFRVARCCRPDAPSSYRVSVYQEKDLKLAGYVCTNVPLVLIDTVTGQKIVLWEDTLTRAQLKRRHKTPPEDDLDFDIDEEQF
jgi:hypothetical protein